MTEETNTMEKPLDKLTVKELREMAKGIEGVSGLSSMKKDELIALLQGAGEGAATAAPAKAAPKAAKKAPAGQPLAMPKLGKKLVSIKDFKDAMTMLRTAKDDAKATASKKDLARLRRRINRLKKRSRKVQPAS